MKSLKRLETLTVSICSASLPLCSDRGVWSAAETSDKKMCVKHPSQVGLGSVFSCLFWMVGPGWSNFKTVFTNEVTLATLGQLGIGHLCPKSFRAADCPEARSESAASAADRWVSHFWYCRKWCLKFLGALALRLKMIQVPSHSSTVLLQLRSLWQIKCRISRTLGLQPDTATPLARRCKPPLWKALNSINQMRVNLRKGTRIN
jgi:hypothetical protein